MDLLETIKLSIEGIRTNKLRSFLTMLGIIIGISSVIAITTIGNGMQKSVNKAFDSFGSKSGYMSVRPKDGYTWEDANFDTYIDFDMANDIEDRFPDKVEGVNIEHGDSSGEIRDGKNVSKIKYTPRSPVEKEKSKIEILAGRFFDKEDMKKRKNVGVISDVTCNEIFGGDINRALGSEIKIKKESGDIKVLTVIGIYKFEKKDFGPLIGNMGQGDNTPVYLPVRAETSEINTSYASVYFKNIETLNEDMEYVTNYLNNKYFSNSKSTEIRIESLQSQLNETMSVMNKMKLAVGAIAAISLMVGGIGVMNILLVSVTERTREIGIRKALGATKNDIRKQFIIESIIICIIGGFFGILLGGSFGYIGSLALKMQAFPSIVSIVVAVGFSMLIGVFFGYYPANKAAKLDPIEALRYE